MLRTLRRRHPRRPPRRHIRRHRHLRRRRIPRRNRHTVTVVMRRKPHRLLGVHTATASQQTTEITRPSPHLTMPATRRRISRRRQLHRVPTWLQHILRRHALKEDEHLLRRIREQMPSTETNLRHCRFSRNRSRHHRTEPGRHTRGRPKLVVPVSRHYSSRLAVLRRQHRQELKQRVPRPLRPRQIQRRPERPQITQRQRLNAGIGLPDSGDVRGSSHASPYLSSRFCA